MNNNFLLKIPFAIAVLMVALASGCGDENVTREIRYIKNESKGQHGLESSALKLAQSFAVGRASADEVNDALDKLTGEEFQALAQNRKDTTSFPVYLTMGRSSPESRQLLKRFFMDIIDPAEPLEKQIKDIDCLGMMKSLINPKRSVDKEAPAEVVKTMAEILNYCQEQINDIKFRDTLNIPLVNAVIQELDANYASSIAFRLKENNFEAWIAWVIKPENSAEGHKGFKSLYEKVDSSQKERMRSEILAESYVADLAERQRAIDSLIDNASDLGLKDGLDTDLYRLGKKGTVISGSLLYVLTKRAIRDMGISPTDIKQTFSELRGYASKFKGALNDDALYLAHVTTTAWGEPPQPLVQTLSAALKPFHYEDFSNFYLAIETPKDVFVAASKPATEVSNEILKLLYDAVIVSDEKALALGAETGLGPERFIHVLLKRPIDEKGFSFAIVSQFLASHFNHEGAGVAGVKSVLEDASGGKNALQLLLEDGRTDDPMFKGKVLAQLLENDDGTTANLAEDATLKAQAKDAFKNRNAGESGPQDFKTLYNKLNADKQKIMRNELIVNAFASAKALQELVDSITSPSDPWGLLGGIAADEYTHAGNTGTLLFILTKRAIVKKVTTPDAYLDLRSLAKAIKATFADSASFQQHVAADLFNGSTIQNTLKTALRKPLNNEEDFADYYLANETIDNVLAASARPQQEVNNASVKKLYGYVIGNSAERALSLSTTGAPGNRRYLHNMLARTVDEDSKNLIVNLFNYAKAANGVAGEQALLSDNSGAVLPMKLLLDDLRPFPTSVGDDKIPEKTTLLNRLLINARNTDFALVNESDLTKNMRIIRATPANFKKIYEFFPANSTVAQAMRSALVSEAFADGNIAVNKLVSEIADHNDIWGLRAGLDNDIYELDRNPIAVPKAQGSLMFVLTQRAIDDKLAGTRRAFDYLRENSTNIKNALGVPQFQHHLTTVIWGGQAINTLLRNALAAMNQDIFTSTYLGNEAVREIYDAAIAVPPISNADLRRLYSAIVGRDPAKATLLAAEKSGGNGFLHRILKREADDDLLKLVDDFLTTLGPAGEVAQLNDMVGDPYPIKIVVDTTRPAVDNPIEKVSARTLLITRLLRNNDTTALATVTEAELEGIKFFSVDKNQAREGFKFIYSQPVITPTKAAAMRNALLKEAYQTPKGINKLLKEITDAQDLWGLQAALKGADYEVARNPVLLGQHTGTLLAVLTARAIDDAAVVAARVGITASASAREQAVIYEGLRTHAELIRNFMETTAPGSYVPYARIQVPLDAVALLQAALDPARNPGHAEYTLLLDDINKKFLMAAVQVSPIDGKKIRWLYEQVIKTDNDIDGLNNKYDLANNKFFHFLVRTDAGDLGPDISAILFDPLNEDKRPAGYLPTGYFERLERQHGNAAVAAEIASLSTFGGVQKNLLELLVDHNRPGRTNKILGRLAIKLGMVSTAAVTNIAHSEDLSILLDLVREFAIKGGPVDELASMMSKVSDANIGHLCSWIAKTMGDIKMFLPLYNDTEIAAAFRHEYSLRQLAVQNTMRTEILERFVDKATVDGNFNKTTYLTSIGKYVVKERLFDEPTLLSSTFESPARLLPLLPLNPSTLLYSALFIAGNLTSKGQLQDLIPYLKELFIAQPAAAWQNYLDSNINQNGTDSILELVKRFPTVGNSDVTAKDWLRY